MVGCALPCPHPLVYRIARSFSCPTAHVPCHLVPTVVECKPTGILKALRSLSSLEKVFQGLLEIPGSLGSHLSRPRTSHQLSLFTGLLPVPHRSPRSSPTPPENCSTWAPRAARCLWCSYQASARWTTGPSALRQCCSGELQLGRGLLQVASSIGSVCHFIPRKCGGPEEIPSTFYPPLPIPDCLSVSLCLLTS